MITLSEKEIALSSERAIAQGARLPSHLPVFSVGIGTIRCRGGCRGFTGPVPPPLWI